MTSARPAKLVAESRTFLRASSNVAAPTGAGGLVACAAAAVGGGAVGVGAAGVGAVGVGAAGVGSAGAATLLVGAESLRDLPHAAASVSTTSVVPMVRMRRHGEASSAPDG